MARCLPPCFRISASRWRLLQRQRGFALVTLVVLGIGTGVMTTVVSVANGLLLRPPPVREPSTLVRVFTGRYSGTPLLDLLAYDEAAETLDIAAFRESRVSVRVGNDAARALLASFVTGNYFDVLGVVALRGRTFLSHEGRTPGTSPVAVLSHRAWQRHFGGHDSAVGRAIVVNGHAFTVVGVMPEAFIGVMGPVAADIWIPVTMHPLLMPGARTFTDRDAFYAQAVARLRPGVSLARAQAEADARFVPWRDDQAKAASEPGGLHLYPLHYLVPELWNRAAVFLAILAGLATSLLGITCLNLASLMVASNSARTREFAVRMAVGAGRGRLLWQLSIEAFCLASGGAVLGVGDCRAADQDDRQVDAAGGRATGARRLARLEGPGRRWHRDHARHHRLRTAAGVDGHAPRHGVFAQRALDPRALALAAPGRARRC